MRRARRSTKKGRRSSRKSVKRTRRSTVKRGYYTRPIRMRRGRAKPPAMPLSGGPLSKPLPPSWFDRIMSNAKADGNKQVSAFKGRKPRVLKQDYDPDSFASRQYQQRLAWQNKESRLNRFSRFAKSRAGALGEAVQQRAFDALSNAASNAGQYAINAASDVIGAKLGLPPGSLKNIVGGGPAFQPIEYKQQSQRSKPRSTSAKARLAAGPARLQIMN